MWSGHLLTNYSGTITGAHQRIDRIALKYIKKFDTIYPNGYNLLEGGDNYKHNIYTKQIISEK